MPAKKSNPDDKEHFVTLFDLGFLPIGLSLYQSLLKQANNFQLWIVCMDERVEAALEELKLPHVSLIPLREIESPELLQVKPARSRAEYCWTLTSFTMDAVFERDSNAKRVTYLDADLYFFDSPSILLDEFSNSGKDVLITEHAYAPEYDQTATSGRFCVQFQTFSRTEKATQVIQWWQARCLECCSAVPVDGKFGDQKYLDEWPTLFGDVVHILQTPEKTLAPWNAGHQSKLNSGKLEPVFYHFHGLRLFQGNLVRLYSGYRIPDTANGFYVSYLDALKVSREMLRENNITVSSTVLSQTVFERLRRFKRWVKQTERFDRLS